MFNIDDIFAVRNYVTISVGVAIVALYPNIFGVYIAGSLCASCILLNAFIYVSDQYNTPRTASGPAFTWSKISSEDVALITGGSRGLGLEMVKRLLEYGIGKVIIMDVIPPPPPLSVLAPEKVQYVETDVGNEQTLKSNLDGIIRTLASRGQHVSVLINNAGIDHRSSVLSIEDEALKRLFNVNSFSQIWTLRKIISNHIENHSHRRLFIVSISSILGVLAPKNLSIYSASKAMIIQIHEGLTQEMKEYSERIRLLLVTPGQLDTGMFKDIANSSEFFAPVVSHAALAEEVTRRINTGHAGVMATPLYANFLPIVKAMPIWLQDLCRWASGMDKKITSRDHGT